MQRLGQPLLQGPDDEAAHEAAVAEAHLGLGGMDVDVDRLRIAGDEQRRDRVPAGGQKIEIGGAQGARQRLVAHRPAIDEEILGKRVRPREGRQADPPGKPHALAARIELERICGEFAAERLAQALGQARFARPAGRPVERRADVGQQRKADVRVAERQPADDVGDGLRLGAVGFEELEPRRRRDKEVARLDPRPDRAGARGDRALRPVLDEKPQARRRAGRAGADLEPRDRGDRGQRLAAEAEGHDGGQIAVGDFRGGVALDREREVGFVHAAPVVGHADETAAARLDRDLDRPRAGVERVLDQFLHRRSRPLDHLARGDAIDKQGIETANWHGRAGPRPFIASAKRRGKQALAKGKARRGCRAGSGTRPRRAQRARPTRTSRRTRFPSLVPGAIVAAGERRMKLEGGCYCGKVRYIAEGEPRLRAFCYCRECQMVSGGGPNLFMLMPPEGFRYVRGAPKTFTRSDLDQPVTREFCETCGTHLANRNPRFPFVILKIGTLDDPALYGVRKWRSTPPTSSPSTSFPKACRRSSACRRARANWVWVQAPNWRRAPRVR